MFRCRTEEEYGELKQLLEDVSSYMKNFAVQKTETTEKSDLKISKEEENKRNGLGMRRAAMEGLSSMLFPICVNCYLCFSTQTIIILIVDCKAKTSRGRGGMPVSSNVC